MLFMMPFGGFRLTTFVVLKYDGDVIVTLYLYVRGYMHI